MAVEEEIGDDGVEEVRKEKVDIEEVLYMVTVKDESDHGVTGSLTLGVQHTCQERRNGLLR